MNGLDVAGFIQAAAAASLLAKMTVDGIKTAFDLPRWAPIILAFLMSQCAEFLLLLSQGATFNSQLIAQAIIIGFFAWGMAIGVTGLQTKADKVAQKIDAALNLPIGSTQSDVEQAVKAEVRR